MNLQFNHKYQHPHLQNNDDFEPDALTYLSPTENMIWLIFGLIFQTLQLCFLIKFSQQTGRLLIKHKTDAYTKWSLILLNVGIFVQTIGLNVEDTMSLLYSISQQGDSDFQKWYRELDEQYYHTASNVIKMIHTLGLYLRNIGFMINAGRWLRLIITMKYQLL